MWLEAWISLLLYALGFTFPLSKMGLVGNILVIKEDQGLESVEHIVGAQKKCQWTLHASPGSPVYLTQYQEGGVLLVSCLGEEFFPAQVSSFSLSPELWGSHHPHRSWRKLG